MKNRNPLRLHRGLLLLTLGLGSLGPALAAPASAPAQAVNPISSEQLIDALRPAQPGVSDAQDESAPVRTRGLRNLVVREKAQGGTVVPAPGDDEVPGAAVQAAASAAVAPSISLNIQFAFNSSSLRPEGMAALERLAEALRSPQLLKSRFRIEGHTDAKGTVAYNLQLSQSRAEEVRRFLTRRGVAAERLEAVGKGSAELANPADPMGPENRRVRIVNLGEA